MDIACFVACVAPLKAREGEGAKGREEKKISKKHQTRFEK